MRKLILAAVLGLAACAQTPTPPTLASVQATLATVNAVACAVDAQQQPIVAALAAPVVTAINPAAGVSAAGFVTLDNALLHPAIVAACAAQGGVPVAVPATSIVPPLSAPAK